jgi:signal transduction histidine kinase
VGRVSLAVGQGITGRVAAERQPIAVEDVTIDPRFSWVRGFDIEGLHAMLSVPLVWHDRVIGVLNVQTLERRRFGEDDVDLLRTIAALLAGIVEKGRLQAEVEARLAELTALDAARSELMSVVTHELRTPLSVVRVYLDLLAEAAAGRPPAPDAETANEWRDAALEQVARLDHLVDSILASVRGEGLTGLSRLPFDAVEAVAETVETLRLVLRPHPIRWERPVVALVAVGDAARFKQVLEQLLDNEAKYAPSAGGVSIGVWRVGDEVRVYVTDDGPGVPSEDWESVFEPFVRIDGRGRSRGSGIGLFAARRLMDAMGGRVWLEPNGYGGSRFVVALPAEA